MDAVCYYDITTCSYIFTNNECPELNNLYLDYISKYNTISDNQYILDDYINKLLKIDIPPHLSEYRQKIINTINLQINRCITCKRVLGSNNPRQYCMKTYCPYEDDKEDK